MKNPHIASVELQDSNEDGLHDPVTGRKPLQCQEVEPANLHYAKQHSRKPQNFWDKIIWNDETKGM